MATKDNNICKTVDRMGGASIIKGMLKNDSDYPKIINLMQEIINITRAVSNDNDQYRILVERAWGMGGDNIVIDDDERIERMNFLLRYKNQMREFYLNPL